MMDLEGLGMVMPHSTTHPKYLHSNSTSHVWAFGAIAELVDNALDAGASKFYIDLLQTSQLFSAQIKTEPDTSATATRTGHSVSSASTATPSGPCCMTFRDNGKGMTPLELHKMLSFGHCDKDKFMAENGQVMPIGHYGNGFKSGSMRLGKDALVFTKCAKTQSVGLLSQTFLKETGAIEVLVPIVSWENETEEPISVSFAQQTLAVTPVRVSTALTEAFKTNIKAITRYSPYKSIAALRMQLDKIPGNGTHIVVYNLRKPDLTDEPCEFSLVDNSEIGIEDDIQLTRSMWDEVTVAAGHTLAPTFYSLREYTSILYLNPRMQIWIRGHKVPLRKLEHCLYKPRQYTYRPKASDDPVTVTLGFNKFSEKEHFGMMLYHRDRLIKSFLHVGYQLSPDSRGVGVIGVLNVNILQPTHNKQDFIMDNNYRLLVNNLKDQLARYWAMMIPSGTLTGFWVKLARSRSRGKACAQCSKCMKWRTVKANDDIPELWECGMLGGGHDCTEPQILPAIPRLIKKGTKASTSDVERKLEEQVVKIRKRHKDTLSKLRMVKAKELATATGFSVDKCVAALRASADNKVVAGELLFSDKPIPGYDIKMDEEEEEELEDIDLDDGEEHKRQKRRRTGSGEEEEEEGTKRKRRPSSSSSSSFSSGKTTQPRKRGRPRKVQVPTNGGVESSDPEDEIDHPPNDHDHDSDDNGAANGGQRRLTEREKRFAERQKIKQRMLEERMTGRDSGFPLGAEVPTEDPDKEKGKEKEDDGSEESVIDIDEHAAATGRTTTTKTTRRKKKKKGGPTRKTAKRRSGRVNQQEEEDDEEEEEEEAEDSDEDATLRAPPSSSSSSATRPYGSMPCSECEDLERALRRKNEEVEGMRRRIRELEEELQRAKESSAAALSAQNNENHRHNHHSAVKAEPIMLVIKDEPEYDFIEFI